MNYRVGTCDGTPVDAEFRAAVHKSISLQNYEVLLQGDELKIEQEAGRVFSGYETPEPKFAPTYKVQRSLPYAEYNPLRTPSYTDRILVHSLPGAKITNDLYDAVFEVKSSDHKPVRGTYTISERKAQPRLQTQLPMECRPRVLFNSITVYLSDPHSCIAREILVELHTDPWWAHGHHGYSRCSTESKPVISDSTTSSRQLGAEHEGVRFDFGRGTEELRSDINPEAQFRIENLEGTHLFLCLVDPSKRVPSESGLGHSTISMDAVWEQQISNGSRTWHLNLISNGLIIGEMTIDLEILNWGENALNVKSRLHELHALLEDSPPETERLAIISQINEINTLQEPVMNEKTEAVMATAVPDQTEEPCFSESENGSSESENASTDSLDEASDLKPPLEENLTEESFCSMHIEPKAPSLEEVSIDEPHADSTWVCDHCTLINKKEDEVCIACRQPRMSSTLNMVSPLQSIPP